MADELSNEELEDEAATELPPREAMSVVSTGEGVETAGWADIDVEPEDDRYEQ
jgi:hypothetical protein